MAALHIRKIIFAGLAAVGLFVSIAPSSAQAFAQAPAPVPALPDTERRTSYSISASTCSCAVGFALYGDSTDVTNWLTVWVNGVQMAQSGNWTVTSPSGSLATLPRPITDAVLTFTNAQTGTIQIVGARRPRRANQFSENRGVAARDLNQAITDLEAQTRELWDRQTRTVQAPPGETLNILPALASRQNLGACFDSGGNLTSCASIPSSTFAAGNGITLTGTNPTTIANNIQAGNAISLTGTSPIIIANTFSVTCGAGLSGGTITTSGTCAVSVPYMEAYLSANQTGLSDGVAVLVNFNTVVKDSNSWFNTSKHLYTPQLAGSYRVYGKIRCSVATAISNCSADVRLNGAAYARFTNGLAGSPSADVAVDAIVPMNGSTDHVEIYGAPSGTGGSDLFNGGTAPNVSYMIVQCVSP